MAIGGSVDDGAFQDIVALDFPSGIGITVESIEVNPTHAWRILYQEHGDQLSEFTATVCDGYDGETLLDTIPLGSSFFFDSTPTITICRFTKTVSIPDGLTQTLYGEGMTVSDALELTRIVIRKGATVVRDVTVGDQCFYGEHSSGFAIRTYLLDTVPI